MQPMGGCRRAMAASRAASGRRRIDMPADSIARRATTILDVHPEAATTTKAPC
jgi:hypothetical protein